MENTDLILLISLENASKVKKVWQNKKKCFFFLFKFFLTSQEIYFYLLDAPVSQAIDCDIYGGIYCRTIISMVVVEEEEE